MPHFKSTPANITKNLVKGGQHLAKRKETQVFHNANHFVKFSWCYSAWQYPVVVAYQFCNGEERSLSRCSLYCHHIDVCYGTCYAPNGFYVEHIRASRNSCSYTNRRSWLYCHCFGVDDPSNASHGHWAQVAYSASILSAKNPERINPIGIARDMILPVKENTRPKYSGLIFS